MSTTARPSIPPVEGIPLIRSRGGPRRGRPAKLHADKGYDYRHLWQWSAQRGIRHRIARKGVERSQRLGRHRWTIERTMAWLAGCRRLHRRYERKAEHFLAFGPGWGLLPPWVTTNPQWPWRQRAQLREYTYKVSWSTSITSR